jgi:altronate dehydratase
VYASSFSAQTNAGLNLPRFFSSGKTTPANLPLAPTIKTFMSILLTA